jgi:hypothetical protein
VAAVILAVAIATAVVVDLRAQRRASDRCALTPPGQRSNGATDVATEWSWHDFGYRCVYRRNGIVLETRKP